MEVGTIKVMRGLIPRPYPVFNVARRFERE